MKLQTFLYTISLVFLLTNCQSKETFNPIPFVLLGLNGEDRVTYESEENAASTTTESSSSSAQGSLTTGTKVSFGAKALLSSPLADLGVKGGTKLSHQIDL
ncbi:MAG: hypothetical protein AAF518_09335 [Spirochaetota bacterium]